MHLSQRGTADTEYFKLKLTVNLLKQIAAVFRDGICQDSLSLNPAVSSLETGKYPDVIGQIES